MGDTGDKKDEYEQNLAFLLLGHLIGDFVAVACTRRKKKKVGDAQNGADNKSGWRVSGEIAQSSFILHCEVRRQIPQ